MNPLNSIRLNILAEENDYDWLIILANVHKSMFEMKKKVCKSTT